MSAEQAQAQASAASAQAASAQPQADDLSVSPNWTASPIVDDYTSFSGTAFNGAYHWQSAIGVYRAGLHHTTGRILDIGCGPGWMTFILKQYAPQASIYGLDLSDEMVVKARGFAAERGLSSLTFTAGAAESLPYRDESFDLVTSCFSLRLWSDPLQGLREAYRVLKPGGLMYIADISGDIPEAAREDILAQAPDNGRYFLSRAMASGLTVDRTKQLLEQTGLTQWECLTGGLGGYLPTSREMLDLIGEGLPAKELYQLVKGQAWAREMGNYWTHIYIAKPQSPPCE